MCSYSNQKCPTAVSASFPWQPNFLFLREKPLRAVGIGGPGIWQTKPHTSLIVKLVTFWASVQLGLVFLWISRRVWKLFTTDSCTQLAVKWLSVGLALGASLCVIKVLQMMLDLLAFFHISFKIQVNYTNFIQVEWNSKKLWVFRQFRKQVTQQLSCLPCKRGALCCGVILGARLCDRSWAVLECRCWTLFTCACVQMPCRAGFLP